MPIVRQVFHRTRQLSTAIKDVGRLREIVGILLNHGFGYLLENVQIPGMGRIKARRLASGQNLSTAERALQVITDLGPTYVKVGQILSTKPDLVPPDFVAAFQTLQDQVTPMPLEGVRAQIYASLKEEPEILFEWFDSEPLASASIAQVHRARLRTGEEVVLKIQRPGVRATILRDLELILFLARQIEKNFPEAKMFDLSGIVGEIERSIKAETDFRVEAGNLKRFAQNFEGDENVHIPILYQDFSTAEILTMEYLDGIKITHAEKEGRDQRKLGRLYLDAAYKMLFRDGFFHGDLHPGNVIVLENDVLGFIDFGMVGRLNPQMQDNVIESVYSLLNMDFQMIAKIFWEIGIKDEPISYQAFEADIIEVMERHLVGKSINELQMGLFFKDILEGAVKHRMRTPTGYTMLFKGLVTTEGMAKMLVPDINPLDVSRPYIEALIRERYGPERLRRESFYYLSAFVRIAHRIPIALGQLITDIEEHRLRMTVDVSLPPAVRSELRRTDDRRILGAISVGCLIAGALTVEHGAPWFLGLPGISVALFIVAVSGIALLFMGYPRN